MREIKTLEGEEYWEHVRKTSLKVQTWPQWKLPAGMKRTITKEGVLLRLAELTAEIDELREAYRASLPKATGTETKGWLQRQADLVEVDQACMPGWYKKLSTY